MCSGVCLMPKDLHMARKVCRGQAPRGDARHLLLSYYEIQEVGRGLERMGIDRLFTTHAEPLITYTVEYKADSVAAQTSNVFLEGVSVDTGNRSDRKRGWLLKTAAQIIVYYLPPKGIAYILNAYELKSHYKDWQRIYATRRSGVNTDGGYRSSGVTVPLSVIAKLALLELKIDEVRVKDDAVLKYQELLEQGLPILEAARQAKEG